MQKFGVKCIIDHVCTEPPANEQVPCDHYPVQTDIGGTVWISRHIDMPCILHYLHRRERQFHMEPNVFLM